jgi:hypothetical protein
MSKSVLRRLAIQQEANVKECKTCKEKKLRILYGKYPSMNNKYVDESGALWCGRICPPCNQKRIKEKMQKLREGRKIVINPTEAQIIINDQENK